jgi:hypothetical protein
MKRITMLYIHNDTIDDGWFTPELAKTLREYADMIDNGTARNLSCDTYTGPRGTMLTRISSCFDGGQTLHG